MADDTRLRDRITGDRLLLAAVLLVGIAGTGVVRRQLGVWGLNQLGRIVFVLGYGGMVFVIWYGWIRPLDISGPSGDGDSLYERKQTGDERQSPDVGDDAGAPGGDADQVDTDEPEADTDGPEVEPPGTADQDAEPSSGARTDDSPNGDADGERG